MAVWASFMDLVHLIGGLGCLALTGGFAAEGSAGRAVFYGLVTMAFAISLARRRQRHEQVIDVREPATTSTPSAAAAGRTCARD